MKGKRLFMLLSYLLCANFYSLAHTTSSQTEVIFKEAAINKQLDTTSLKRVSSELNYDKTKRVLVPRFQYKPSNKNKSNPSSPNLGFLNDFLTFLAYAVVGLLVFTLIYFVFKDFKLKNKLNEVFEIELDNIKDITVVNFGSMLQAALNQKDYRLALRIRFLMLLQKLQRSEHIVWKPDKTNRVYARELSNNDHLASHFKVLSLAFETVWYGNTSIDENGYHKLEYEFSIMDKSIAV